MLGELRHGGISSQQQLITKLSGRHSKEQVENTLADFAKLGLIGDCSGAAPKPLNLENPSSTLNTLVLNVNTGCNLSCSYCYKEDLAIPSAGKRMGEQTAIASVDRLFTDAPNEPRYNIVFFGGEPLSNLPLIRAVINYAEEKSAKTGKQIDFSLTTNATLLKEEVVDYLNAHRVGIAISMDGPKVLHDKNRKTVGGRGTYDLVRAKADMLLSRYTSRPVGARVTLTTGVTDVVAIHQHLRDELGFFEVGYAPVTAGDIAAFNLTVEELDLVFDGFKELGRAYRHAAIAGRNSGFSNMHQLMFDLHNGNSKALPCGAGVGLLSVDHEGDLHLCHRFTGSDLPTFGNVTDGIDSKGLADFITKAADKTGLGCETCRIRSICAGGCYHERYARYDDPLHPAYHYCDLLRDWVDFGIETYVAILDKNPDFFDRHITPRTVQRAQMA